MRPLPSARRQRTHSPICTSAASARERAARPSFGATRRSSGCNPTPTTSISWLPDLHDRSFPRRGCRPGGRADSVRYATSNQPQLCRRTDARRSERAARWPAGAAGRSHWGAAPRATSYSYSQLLCCLLTRMSMCVSRRLSIILWRSAATRTRSHRRLRVSLTRAHAPPSAEHTGDARQAR